MLRSMTGFARKKISAEWGEFTWEIKSLNHRFLDIHLKIPELIRSEDLHFRQTIKRMLSRGKIDASLNITFNDKVTTQAVLNQSILQALEGIGEQLMSRFSIPSQMILADCLRLPGLIEFKTILADPILNDISSGLSQGLQELVDVRKQEGEQIVKVLLEKLEFFRKGVEVVQLAYQSSVEHKSDQLREAVSAVVSTLDSNRLEQEILLLSQKLDITEELDRLKIHIKSYLSSLTHGGIVGRKLDFLLQEMNREVNTIGSKSQDGNIASQVVELKVWLEQMKEQIQNIE